VVLEWDARCQAGYRVAWVGASLGAGTKRRIAWGNPLSVMFEAR